MGCARWGEDAGPLQETEHGAIQVAKGCERRWGAGDQDHVDPRRKRGVLTASELSDAAPDPVAHHGVAGASANCDSYSGGAAVTPSEDVACQQGACPASPAAPGPIKVCCLPKSPFPPHDQNPRWPAAATP